MASKNKGRYVSIGVLQYRSELDDKKQTARTYNPGDVINEDLEDHEVERLVKRGAIKEAKLAKAEQAHRDEAAETARLAQEAAEQAQAEADAQAAAAAGDSTPVQTSKPNAGKKR